MEALKFLSCKKCKNCKPAFLTNCCCFFCEKCFNVMTESARTMKLPTLKCEICNKQINLQTIIDLKDTNKLNLLFFPEKNFTTINNLFSNLNFCIQFFKEQTKFLSQKLEEKDSSNAYQEAELNLQKNTETINKQNLLIQQQNEENEKLKELIKLKEQTMHALEKNKQDLQDKKQKFEEENSKFLDKIQKQEEKLAKATEKLKKYKEELSIADEEYKEAQNYIKKQKESKETMEKQLKEMEEKLKNYELLLTNKNNKTSNIQTVKPSEFTKNMKPTLNKYPTIQNKENFGGLQNKEKFPVYYEDEAKKTNILNKNQRETMNRNSKEFSRGDDKITEVQKEYIKNIYDEKYKMNNENNKKRKIDNEMELINKSKVDFQKSFGFKQMKFL